MVLHQRILGGGRGGNTPATHTHIHTHTQSQSHTDGAHPASEMQELASEVGECHPQVFITATEEQKLKHSSRQPLATRPGHTHLVVVMAEHHSSCSRAELATKE